MVVVAPLRRAPRPGPHPPARGRRAPEAPPPAGRRLRARRPHAQDGLVVPPLPRDVVGIGVPGAARSRHRARRGDVHRGHAAVAAVARVVVHDGREVSRRRRAGGRRGVAVPAGRTVLRRDFRARGPAGPSGGGERGDPDAW